MLPGYPENKVKPRAGGGEGWDVAGRAGVWQETLSLSLPHTAGLRSLRTAESPGLPEPLVQMSGPCGSSNREEMTTSESFPGRKHQPGGPGAKQ